ncbi:MAG: type II secretion system protein GspC [Gammaproteobacteria bacterium]|nr:type II secretion system protein GspC [Gammaproteobacteria bacterium]
MNKDSNSRLPKWVNTVLVALIGYALASVTLKAIPSTEGSPVESFRARDAGAPSAQVEDKLAIGERISNLHLFGDVKEPAPAPKTTVKPPVTKTRLNLKLAGVFAYEPQERAIAIMSADNKPEQAYLVGETIIGNTTLKAVFPDHVIIDNNGKDEKVELPKDVTPIATRRPVQQNLPASNTQSVSAGGPVELPSTPGALRDMLAKNPAVLGQVVAAEPYQENGKLRGFRITPKQNPEILEAQGIIAGDVITRVNNIELNSQKQGIRALRNAVKAQNLDVTILRDGIEIPISISLAE